MKKIINILLIVIVFTTSSCSVQKIDIIGKPGTEIYSRDLQKITQITNSGKTSIEISKNNVELIYLSLDKNNNLYVPFALNFTKRRGYEAKCIFGSLLLWPTLIPGILLTIDAHREQSENKFKYLPEQHTNQDIKFTPLKQTADYKTLNKSSQNVSQQKSNTERRKFNSGSSQSNKDTMSSITGTYSGDGELLDGNIVEKYDDLNIIVKKKDEDTVSVEILASDGYSYFDEEMLYSVTKQDNQYILEQKGKNSRIVIKDGNLSYTNHSINDGDMICSLKVNAKKQ